MDLSIAAIILRLGAISFFVFLIYFMIRLLHFFDYFIKREKRITNYTCQN
ncbi:hypothetical protein PPOP_1999 [Paenibacillus popilliae ATCC 14706]|uniref:Uncharacterized protein n=1 Tax=Paenibacillus popilliae ATCC 14706 TaxID=1212764 RepID=M9LPW7_PAEPP|nr:hypothetical protein PPOP_1999 [Paenibacillus popilliae ATCC 14706]